MPTTSIIRPLQRKLFVISLIALILAQNRFLSLFLAKCANENSNTCKHNRIMIDLRASQKEEIYEGSSTYVPRVVLQKGT